MKVNYFISIILLASLFCACQKELPVSETHEGPEMIKVRAVFADSELSSKASLAEGSDQFEWQAADKVVAWDGNAATGWFPMGYLSFSGAHSEWQHGHLDASRAPDHFRIRPDSRPRSQPDVR